MISMDDRETGISFRNEHNNKQSHHITNNEISPKPGKSMLGAKTHLPRTKSRGTCFSPIWLYFQYRFESGTF